MAAGSICIVTSTGMICSSSKPMKRHFPTVGPEPAKPGLDDIVNGVSQVLHDNHVDGQDAIATVVQLMVQAGVKDDTTFAINGSFFSKSRKKHGRAPHRGHRKKR